MELRERFAVVGGGLMGLTLALRLAAIRWKLGLPVFQHRSDSEP